WDAEVVKVFSFRRGSDSPSSHYLSLSWFRSHVVVLGVRPQLGQASVMRSFLWCSVAALSRSSGEVRGRSQLASREGVAVPAALAGEGLVIPTGPCSRGSLPLLSLARGSSSQELGVGRFAETTVASCAVSSSESECCLRIRGWQCELRGPLRGSGRSGRYKDTMVKVEGMREETAKPVFVKTGVGNTDGTFHNNNNNNKNNYKRPNIGKDYGMEKKVKVEGRQLVENYRFCNKLGH
ncbi:hypothetical protein Taro_050048, partial [Colocasia esculenta]|nr:hypothetical protein [Colocasia esculenta]